MNIWQRHTHRGHRRFLYARLVNGGIECSHDGVEWEILHFTTSIDWWLEDDYFLIEEKLPSNLLELFI
jgi:hypothetical protein